MTDYKLANERMRLVKKNERDKVVARKTFRRGDTITAEDLDKFSDTFTEERIQALLDRGSLVEAGEDLPNEEEQSLARSAAVLGGLQGAATAPVSEHEELDPDNPVDDNPNATADDEEHDVDEFDAMDYSELQEAAKKASPPIAANQSAEDLRAALRAQAQA